MQLSNYDENIHTKAFTTATWEVYAGTYHKMKYCVLFLFFTLTTRQWSQQKKFLPSPDEKYKDLPSFKADKASWTWKNQVNIKNK